MGFGSSMSKMNIEEDEPPKYTLTDKSYGDANTNLVQSQDETQLMNEFFTTYDDWKPLFQNVMTGTPLAHSLLFDTDNSMDDIWDISTMENKRPWKVLPSKPTHDTALQSLSAFLDEWQRSLLDIPIDAFVKEGSNDLHFLEEGRRTIAVTRFHVLEQEDLEKELFATCWSELAHLMSQDTSGTGSLVVLPDLGDEKGLEYVKEFVARSLIRPIQWLGRHEDWEIVAMERGSLAVRLLYKLGDIPDLGERDQSGD
jgi:hypothetical protein